MPIGKGNSQGSEAQRRLVPKNTRQILKKTTEEGIEIRRHGGKKSGRKKKKGKVAT